MVAPPWYIYFAASRVHYEKGSGIQSRKEKNISSIKEDNSDIYHSFGIHRVRSYIIWKEGRRTKDLLNERRNRTDVSELMKKVVVCLCARRIGRYQRLKCLKREREGKLNDAVNYFKN